MEGRLLAMYREIEGQGGTERIRDFAG